MSTDNNDTDSGTSGTAGAADQDTARAASGGDEERGHREQIAETGEPDRDALGNADGAS